MRILLAAALLAAALAGCSGTTEDAAGPDPAGPAPLVRLEPPADPMADGVGHDHADPAAHEFLWHYERTSYDGMLSTPATLAGIHAMDAQAGHLFAAVYGSHAASVDGGMWIWDLSDPSHPVKAGSLTIPGSVGGDRSIGVTQDGSFAVLGLEPVTCFGHVNPLAAGVQVMLVDTTDKSLPVPADVVTVTGSSLGQPVSGAIGLGTHSVEVANINGTEYAFAFGTIYRIDATEQGGRLVPVGTLGTGHDLYVRATPDGRFWGLAANGGGDLTIYDVTDPRSPAELGSWNVPNRDDLDGQRYLHTADVAFVPDAAGDVHAIVVLTSEDWEPHASPFWVLDATDPANMTMLAEWSNPWNHTAEGIHFSLHNPRFHDGGVLSLAQYHGGLLQFDFRDERTWADPYLMAYAVSADGSQASPRDPVEHVIETRYCGLGETQVGVMTDTPLYMDVEYAQDGSGILYAADLTGGLYTFTPTADHPVYGTPATPEA